MTHVRTLKMTEDVLAVKYSPNGRFLAVALLDSTVKVFYADTLKFFLSLYGHKVSHSRSCCEELRGLNLHAISRLRTYSFRSCRWTSRAIPSSS